MSRLDKSIADVAYIRDALMAYRNIVDSGDCNRCGKKKTCEYIAIDVLFNEWKCIDRNDGIHCDRKCESCDLVMDVWIIREAFNMAISALQAQEAKAQLSAEGTTSDLISRRDAIDALMDFDKKLRKINWYQYPHTEYEW